MSFTVSKGIFVVPQSVVKIVSIFSSLTERFDISARKLAPKTKIIALTSTIAIRRALKILE